MAEPRRNPVDDRSPQQLSHEQAMGEVSDVMLNLEHVIERARRAHKRVSKTSEERNIEFALSDLIKELDRARRRLTKDAYFSDDNLRLL